MYYDFLQTHKRTITRIAIGLFALLIIWTAFILLSRIGKLPVTVSVVPSDATITVNNQSEGNGTAWLVPGTYKVKIKKDGYTPQEKTVIVSDKKTDNVVVASLKPESDEAKKWATEHAKEYKDNEKYGAIEASSNGEYFSAINPITKKLPFTDPYYKIGYIVGDKQSITLTVATTSPRWRFYAVEKIREWGYEPTDFVISFTDFKNPLEMR